MDGNLRNLLEEWDIPQEYVQKFEDQGILDLETFNLLDVSAVAVLFPTVGPRLRFQRSMSTWRAEAATHNKDLEDAAAKVSKGDSSKEDELSFSSEVPPINADVNETAELSRKDPQATTQESTPHQGPSKKRAAIRASLYELDLARLLGSCFNGKCVLRFYNQNKDFNDGNRNQLADVILNDYLKDDPNRKLPSEVENAMAESITLLFPTEKREVWASATLQRSTSAGRGKLLCRYYDTRRKLMKNGLLSKAADNSNDSPLSGDEDDDGVDPVVADHLLWLQNNKQPWSKVTSLWALTSKLRYRRLVSGTVPVSQYLTKYPALQDQSGYLLLETDFDLKFPGLGMSLFMKWPQLAAFIESKAPNAEDISDSFTEVGKKVRVIQALPYLFSVITCAKKGKRQWRPSRQEVAEALMLHVKTIGDINISLASRAKEKYEPFNLHLGPQAVVVGSDLDNISHSFVRINSTMYEVENPLKALDITFKAMHALDCKYHKESDREWQFLEKAIYCINVDKTDRKLSTILKSFADFKEKN